jgi:hypothetical protein
MLITQEQDASLLSKLKRGLSEGSVDIGSFTVKLTQGHLFFQTIQNLRQEVLRGSQNVEERFEDLFYGEENRG